MQLICYSTGLLSFIHSVGTDPLCLRNPAALSAVLPDPSSLANIPGSNGVI